MNFWQAILLGLVQGLTEFLPVSSSGHLIIFKEWLGVNSEGFLDFTLVVHLATVCSTIVVFRKEILQLLQTLFSFKYNEKMAYVFKILISMIPIGLVGVFLKDYVESLFTEGLFIVAISLLITAVVLTLSYLLTKKNKVIADTAVDYTQISYLQAFIVGISQCFAVLPGLSRSGTTIAVGLISGVKKEVIAQFSFLMVLVPIIGEQFLKIVSDFSLASSSGSFVLLLGFISAFVSGFLACKIMIQLVKKAKLYYFAIYCFLLALLILLT